MPKYRIYVTASVSRCIGEVEAENEESAIEKANEDLDFPVPTLCHHCSDEWEIGDVNEVIADKC